MISKYALPWGASLDEYKGHPILCLRDEFGHYRIGKKKCELMMRHIDDLKDFLDNYDEYCRLIKEQKEEES